MVNWVLRQCTRRMRRVELLDRHSSELLTQFRQAASFQPRRILQLFGIRAVIFNFGRQRCSQFRIQANDTTLFVLTHRAMIHIRRAGTSDQFIGQDEFCMPHRLLIAKDRHTGRKSAAMAVQPMLLADRTTCTATPTGMFFGPRQGPVPVPLASLVPVIGECLPQR